MKESRARIERTLEKEAYKEGHELGNLIILCAGLEDQLLGIVVRKEKPQLEEQKDNLVFTIASNKRTLKELEDKIL